MVQPQENATPPKTAYGYNPILKKWVAIQVDSDGKVITTT